MKTNHFVNFLNEHRHKPLLFEYAEDRRIAMGYHITEIKNVSVESVDCGGNADRWKESVVQLWESPVKQDKKSYMTASKALAIFDKVNRMRPLSDAAELYFEFGNESFHTAHFSVNRISVTDRGLVVKLAVRQAQCKAADRCGTREETTEKKEACCTPGGGCC